MAELCNPDEIAALKARIASLNTALSTGARSVTLGGQTIIYNTTESLIKARDDFRRQLAAAEAACLTEGGGRKASRHTYTVYGGRDY